MRDIYLQSKLQMAKTLHANGVDLLCIVVATGLTRPKLIAELNIVNKTNKPQKIKMY
ncbi:hypothetical protein [[Enterobacter] lignolyticus]|uniref:Uncharacterized protein n=1 Tax=Enterobacter lignolyticus (strain SCF1) TaxID=701347 RepID=E3G2W2_ENTLS|nr:hypothetical protein [[Enterobacter] lignolyticus]ADO49229.1 hypothetical protein Entcl_2982 [[Enterobacter] lignolyticus SCF1]